MMINYFLCGSNSTTEHWYVQTGDKYLNDAIKILASLQQNTGEP